MMDNERMSPMKGTWPDPEKIKCRKCKFRDKTTVEIDGKPIPFGITKCICDKYIGVYAGGNDKPSEILFQNADCDYYEKE